MPLSGYLTYIKIPQAIVKYLQFDGVDVQTNY